MKYTIFVLALLLGFAGPVNSQESKPPLDFSVYDTWKSLKSQQVDRQGNWISYEISPYRGDGLLYLRDWSGQKEYRFERGTGARLSPGGKSMLFRIIPQSDTTLQKERNKVKKADMPKDSLGLFVIQGEKVLKFPKVKNYKVAGEFSEWIAFQLEEEQKKEKDTTEQKKEKKKKKEYNGTLLHVMHPVTGDSLAFADVTDYGFSDDGKILYMVSIEEDSINTSRIRLFDTDKGEERLITEQEGVIQDVVLDEETTQLAYLYSQDTTKEKVFNLYHYVLKKREPVLLVDTLTAGMPEGWCVQNEGNNRIGFSKDGSRLFLGMAPKPEPEPEDTLLDKEKVFLDIWHWKDVVVQSIQTRQVNREKNKNYLAVMHLKKGELVQLTTPEWEESVSMDRDRNLDLAVMTVDKPYELDNALNFISNKDVYLLDVTTGEKNKLFEKVGFRPQLSPAGSYLYWWEPMDSSWYVYDIQEQETRNLTDGIPVSFADELMDRPDDARSYGTMGWAKNDRYLFINDKHEIWQLDPKGDEAPVNILNGYGSQNDLEFRYVNLDRERRHIPLDEYCLFYVFNLQNKQSGYYRMQISEGVPEKIMMDDCQFSSRPTKAEEADKLLWTRSSVSEYPDLWISMSDFSQAEKITRTNPQQDDYNWITVELVEWTNLDGVVQQGLLYKPENFDPNKKYPMMVYFYEKHSRGLHSHIFPRASSSTINTAFYGSNGYLVFHPDIHYKDGFPGKSAYNAIVSGVMHLGERSYVDLEHVGLQGQSWGGYETAYLITQTDLFAAASPGAPVSNMTSAYGGIRTSSGMIRQVQYETGQSRIGGTLWEKLELYIENSPLFYADRINTPCLIRHNDNDGAVPWAQGVEFFVALRRLGKPAWMLNYNNDAHNLTTKYSNRKDLSVRMKQFFDHYLKGTPAPKWMTDGVPAVDKKKNEAYYKEFMK